MQNEINGALELVPQGAGELSVVSREQTEIQSAIIVAKKFPRNEQAAFLAAIKAFERPAMAEAATYGFKRGGSTITGPSVDCARTLARAWGNIRYGLRIIEQSKEEVHVRGYALDVETNSYVEAEDKFAKKIQRKREGSTYWVEPDERDLRELIFRRGAILIRNCILQILPSDLIDDALSTATNTLEKVASNQLKDSKEDTLKKLVVVFDRIGVSVKMLEEYLNHPLIDSDASELVALRTIAKSIKDGAAQKEEFFVQTLAPEQTTTDKLKAKLRAASKPEGQA